MTGVFAHGALRLYLLSLLTERPMHGYELMQALERRFGGTYQPSAGTIYPRLAKLEAEGLVTKTADGRRATFAITDAGRAELADRAGELDALEHEISDSVRRLADEVRGGVEEAMRTLRADLAAARRDASEHPRSAPAPTTDARGDDPRAETRLAIHDVDVAATRLRADLRKLVRSQTPSAAQAARIRSELDEVLLSVRAILTEH